MLLRKAIAVEEETKLYAQLYHQYNQSIHLTVGMTAQKYGLAVQPQLLQFQINGRWV